MSEPDFRMHSHAARLLEGRRAFVTGATTGIGQGTAYELAAHGAAVAINYRGKEDEAGATAAAIEAAGGRAVPVAMDVSDEDDVAPGAISTPINEEVLADEQERRRVQSEIPLGRWGAVADVARAVAWAASDQADYVVGTTIFVDGGMTLYPNFV